MTLYNCRSTDTLDSYRITKFDSDLNPEASYTVSRTQCQCPAYGRPSCRHRDMLPHFLRHGRVDTGWMCEWDGEPSWRQFVGPAKELPAEPAEADEASSLNDIHDGSIQAQGYIPFAEPSGSAPASADRRGEGRSPSPSPLYRRPLR